MAENIKSTDLLGILEDRTVSEVYSPSNEEQELEALLQKQFDDAHRYRLAWERQWELNRLYLKGQQLLVRNRTTGEVLRLQGEETSRLIALNNVIRPTFRSLLGKLTRTIPTARAIPPTNDLQELHGARIADSLLRYHFRKEHLDRKYIDLYRNALLFGTGIIKLSWDPELGRKNLICTTCDLIVPEEEREGYSPGDHCPACLDQAEQETQQNNQMAVEEAQLQAFTNSLPFTLSQVAAEEVDLSRVTKLEEKPEGDIRIDVVDPRDLFLDSSAQTLEEAQWYCHRVAMSVTEIRRRFPEHAKYISTEGRIYTEQHTSLAEAASNTRGDLKNVEDHAFLYEFHEKPTGKHPKGRIIWKVNNIILREMEDPYYALNRFNLYVMYWEKNVGEFWGESFIEQAWTLQRELNLLLTQMREQRELTNRPKLFVPFGSQIAVDELDTTAGQIISFNANAGRPFYGEIPSFAAYTYSEIERLKGDIRTQASVTEQEAGITSAEASGRYAAILESESGQQVGPILRYNHSEWIELHRGILLLCQEMYTPDRKWTVQGTDVPQTNYFDEMNLMPGWDIDLQEDDSLSNNHAIKLQQVLNLWDRGMLTDPNTGMPDVKKFCRMSGVKIPGIGVDDSDTDHLRAAAIPGQLKHGQQYEPKPWDNAVIFAEELLSWLKGPGNSEDPQLVEQVSQIWQFYAQLTQGTTSTGTSQQMPGGASKAQGGSAGAAPAGENSAPVLGDAEGIVQNADQEAEAQAQISPQHEG
jgi:hypothetical protein